MDEAQRRNVIVLGNELLKTLFPGRPAVGAFVLLNGLRFQVIGSMPHLGRGDNTWLNMRGYVPFPVMATYFPLKGENHQNSISFVEYQPRMTAEHQLAQDDVHKVIARNHGFDASDQNAFDGWDSIQESKMVGTIFDVMNMFLGAVGMVTLALGAIGVINIMLVAVSERTHEIGLRKALGATNRSILFHFFLEGLLLTLGSGLIGMGLGIATVVMLLAYGDGFGQACANIFANFGTKLVIVVPGRTSMQAGGQKSGVLIRFTQEDVDTLATNLPQITHITPEVSKQASIQYDTRVFTWAVTGNYANVIDVRALKLGQGRFYNAEDEIQRSRVPVIGSEAKEKLFSGRNALGERIRVNGLSFEVIGGLSAKMQEGNDDINRVVSVPLSTMAELKVTHYLDSIWFPYQPPEYQCLEQ